MWLLIPGPFVAILIAQARDAVSPKRRDLGPIHLPAPTGHRRPFDAVYCSGGIARVQTRYKADRGSPSFTLVSQTAGYLRVCKRTGETGSGTHEHEQTPVRRFTTN